VKSPGGVSIGIQDSPEQLLDKIHNRTRRRYRRIKIKVKPGWDVNILEKSPRGAGLTSR